MEDRLARVLAFDRGVRARGGQRRIELPAGMVVRHDELPMLYHLNTVILDAPLPESLDATALVELADEHLGDANHRQLVFDDAVAAERIAPQLLAAGWTRQRVVFMVHAGAPDQAPRPGLAREIDEGEAHALALELLAEEAPRTPGVVVAVLAGHLVAGQEALRAGTRSMCFGAGEDGGIQSMCTLFLSEGAEFALIEEVGTLAAHRGRGLARAAIGAALKVALELGASEIIVPADHDDWPQLLYLKLGFEPLGHQVTLTLTSKPALREPNHARSRRVDDGV